MIHPSHKQNRCGVFSNLTSPSIDRADLKISRCRLQSVPLSSSRNSPADCLQNRSGRPMGSSHSLPTDARNPLTLLLGLPNELLILVASYIDLPRYVYALLRTNQRLAFITTPLLHKLAVQNRRGRTALQWAAYRGHLGLAKLLLSKDTNHAPVVHGYPMTPLYYAVKSSRFEVVKLLLDHGAHLNTTAALGYTPQSEHLSTSRNGKSTSPNSPPTSLCSGNA